MKRRKCAYCGKWEYDMSKLIHVGGTGTCRSESQFAHSTCAEKVKNSHGVKR